ncbi:flagellar biosynthesis protein FlhF [Aliikangiella coralliicola]|uniref:Flagellar biosynthesis protein FlhF n=1 Tax=Aliikangiella coralliicola TaxID=2592383 RepID=A0A545UB69_9GAMM|nr:flagellar biosynthesis protein FlhF [Aliikangiella coralliicola]TQV86697.1 flagellar biosynthesis protein FlhF [Aliikangiella coralliicola]
MKIRRFYGSNIRIALREVVEEFGEDAAILSNKKVAGGVEVIAALDYDESLTPAAMQSSMEATESASKSKSESFEQMALAPGSESAETGHSEPKDIGGENRPSLSSLLNGKHTNPTQVDKSTIQSLRAETQIEAEPAQSAEQISSPFYNEQTSPGKLEWSLDPSLQAMKEELGLMRVMMSEQLKGIAWNRFAEKDPMSAMVMRRLSALGLTNEVVNSLLPYVNTKLDSECAWQQVLAVMAKSLPVANNELIENGGIYAFMGPTGVGKTTTIAKLAARFVIKHGADSVALITTDNYRISAYEQLATFGRLLKLPCAKINEQTPLENLLKKFADKKLILIDTAGMSSEDPQLMGQFEEIVASRKPIRKLLLMSAACQEAVLLQSMALFSRFSPDAVVITKLDEAVSLGEVISVILKHLVPVLYTTDGQRIPEDIRVARSHHLVSKAVWLANKYTRSTDEWNLAQNVQQVKAG